MARKRRDPAPPPPPPPPPQESSTDSGFDTDKEEEARRAAAHPKPPQNPQPYPPAATADGADSSYGESESDADADAFQVRPVFNPGSDAAESSESEPEVPEPVQKKAAATTNKSKTAVTEDKKRPAPEPAPSGRAKKTKAEAVKAAPEATSAGKGKKTNAAERQKAAPEATPAGKGKKTNDAEPEKAAPEATPAGKGKKANNAEPEKAAPEATPAGKGKKANAEREETIPAGKGKKAKKPADKPENPGLDTSPSSKSARVPHRWSKEDSMKILEAVAAHVKTEGALPKTEVILAAVRDHLERKDCTYTDMYERVRRLRERYEKAVRNGVVPSEEDELQMYNLSEAIWGEKAKEAMAATASQNNSTATMSKKGQAKKEKMSGNSKGTTVSEVLNQNGDTQKGSKKGHAVEVKTDKDVKSKLSKEDTTPASPSKSKKLGNVKQELGKGAKSGTLKETPTTATQNGDAMTKRKGEKMGKDKMDIDLKPEEALTGIQNRGARTEEETHEEETEIETITEGTQRSFDELQDLYPCLSGYMKKIEAESTCGETLKRAFGFIDNEKANVLESKMKALRLLELKAQIRREGLQREVLNMFISLAD